MTRASLTKLLPFVSCVTLTACLGNSPQTQPAPSPPAVAAESELAAALCTVWARTAPTWADADTEETKDQIDYAIRSQETACRDYGPR